MGDYQNFLYNLANEYKNAACKIKYDDPKVSIIVPAYNVESYIERCLASLIKQTLQDIEIIIVDDGSTDMTPAIIDVFASIDKRIVVIHQENRKQGAARNRGLEVAKGEYICFVDSDDWIDEDYCEKMYNAAVKNNSDMAVASVIKHKSMYSKYNVLYKNERIANDLEEKIKICEDKTHRFFYSGNKIYKNTLIKDNNILFAEGRIYEDVIFAIKAIYYANKVVTVPNIEYHYVAHSNSTVKSKDNIRQKKKDHILAYIELNDFAKEHQIKLAERLNYIESYWKFPCIKVYEGMYKIKELLFGFIPIRKMVLTDKNNTYTKEENY